MNYNKINEAGFNEATIFGPSKNNPLNLGMFNKKYDLKGSEFIKPLSSTYSISIYENGIKTEWSVDGIVGDKKYFKLLEYGNGKDLPDMINITTKINNGK